MARALHAAPPAQPAHARPAEPPEASRAPDPGAEANAPHPAQDGQPGALATPPRTPPGTMIRDWAAF